MENEWIIVNVPDGITFEQASEIKKALETHDIFREYKLPNNVILILKKKAKQ